MVPTTEINMPIYPPLVQAHPYRPINKAYDGLLKLLIGDTLSIHSSYSEIMYRGTMGIFTIDKITGCPRCYDDSTTNSRLISFDNKGFIHSVVANTRRNKITEEVEVINKWTMASNSVQTEYMVVDNGLVKEHFTTITQGHAQEIETHLTLDEYLGTRFVVKDIVRDELVQITFMINTDKDKGRPFTYTKMIPMYIQDYGYLKVVHMTERYITCYSTEKNCYFINTNLYTPEQAREFFTNKILTYKEEGVDQPIIDEVEIHLGCLLNHLG